MIDVIVAAYNAHDTLAKALDSVVKQTMVKDIKVYIADDCSEGTYDKIVKDYKDKLDIKILRLDVNSGPGVARQYALDNSNGEYIVFLDADDEFCDENSIEILYDAIDGYDMVFSRINQKKGMFEVKIHHEGCLHGKMYRRSLIEDNNIRFPSARIKGANAHEDNVFNQLCYCTTCNSKCIDNVTYTYNDTYGSITNSEKWLKSMEAYYINMNYLFDELDKQKSINKYYAGIAAFSVMMYCYYNYLLDEENLGFCFKKLKSVKRGYIKYNKCLSKEDRLRIYKNFDYPVIPDMTFYDFVEKIER